MAYHTRNLPRLVAQTTAADAVTQGVGSLDDAECIHIYMMTTANAASTVAAGLRLQVSQFDPALSSTEPGVVQSTNWHSVSTGIFPVNTSSGACHVIDITGFRGFRLIGLTSALTGEVVAYATKQILV